MTAVGVSNVSGSVFGVSAFQPIQDRSSFQSTLFNRLETELTLSQPEFFPDLDLDQVVASITARRDEYELQRFFHALLRDPEIIKYRQGVFQRLRKSESARFGARVLGKDAHGARPCRAFGEALLQIPKRRMVLAGHPCLTTISFTLRANCGLLTKACEDPNPACYHDLLPDTRGQPVTFRILVSQSLWQPEEPSLSFGCAQRPSQVLSCSSRVCQFCIDGGVTCLGHQKSDSETTSQLGV